MEYLIGLSIIISIIAIGLSLETMYFMDYRKKRRIKEIEIKVVK